MSLLEIICETQYLVTEFLTEGFWYIIAFFLAVGALYIGEQQKVKREQRKAKEIERQRVELKKQQVKKEKARLKKIEEAKRKAEIPTITLNIKLA